MAGLSLYGFSVFYFSEKALCNSVLFLTVSPESESLFSYHMDKCKNKNPYETVASFIFFILCCCVHL